MLIAVCTLFSCGGDDPVTVDPIKPEQPENPQDPENPEIKTKRIKTLKVDRPSGLFTEDKLTYDDQGHIIKIESHIENSDWYDLPEYDAVTTFTYQDKKVIYEVTCNDYSHKQVLQLNDSGYIEKLVYNEKNEWSHSFEYWGDGCLKIKYMDTGYYYAYKYESGNLTTVAFFADNKSSTDYIKLGTFPNKAGISPMLFSDEFCTLSFEMPWELGVDEFALHNAFYLFYNGLYGKHSKNLETSVTDRGDTISFEYKLDEEGYPTKIICTELDNGVPILSSESEDAFIANIEYWED